MGYIRTLVTIVRGIKISSDTEGPNHHDIREYRLLCGRRADRFLSEIGQVFSSLCPDVSDPRFLSAQPFWI